MKYWFRDCQVALYSLKKRPGFVSVIVLTLSLTLSAFITMMTLNYTVLLKPLSYPDQEHLFVVEGERYDNGKFLGSGVHSYAGAVDVYKKNQILVDSVLLHYEEQLISNLPGQPKHFTTYVTPELFRMLGARMSMGRYFDSNEGLNSNTPVALLSYDSWQQDFGGRADILTQKIQIGNVSFSIIGVIDKSFVEPILYLPGRQTRVWLPFDFNSRDASTRQNWTTGFFDLKLVGRLKNGVRIEDANQYFSIAMNDRYVEEARAFSWGKNATVKAKLRSFEDVIVGDSRSTSLMMLAGVFVLLLIALANISNLFLSRAAEKQRQYAIQATLGATKFHILRGVFIEAFVLTLVATIIAMFLANFSFSLLQQYAQGYLARLNELSLSPMIVIFSLAFSILLAAVFGLIISNLINYRKLNNILRSSGKGSGLQISKRTRNVLIISQVALAGVLLSGGITLFKNSIDVINQPAGFNTENLIWIDLDSSGQEFNKQERIAFIETITVALSEMPEVDFVSNALYPPLITNSWTSILTANEARIGTRVLPNVNLVDENYLKIFELPLAAGRNFNHDEIRDSAKVMIINESVAAAFGGNTEVLGKNVFWDDKVDPYQVIGVIKDVFIPRAGQVPQMLTGRTTSMTFMIKLKSHQSVSRSRINDALHNVERNLRIGSFVKVGDAYQSLLIRDISIAAVTIVLALLTLSLAGVGIYGVLNYSVNLRTYELGVRMALGGSPKTIFKLVFFDSSKPVIFGFVISTIMCIVSYTYFVSQTEFNVIFDLSAFIIAFCLISLVSFFACYIPLRRVIRGQPIHALK